LTLGWAKPNSFDILPQLAGLRGWILAVVCRADPGIDHKAIQQREADIAPRAPQAVTMFGLLLMFESGGRTDLTGTEHPSRRITEDCL